MVRLDSDWGVIGHLKGGRMNSLESVEIANPYNKTDTSAKFIIEIANSTYTFTDICNIGVKYVFSCWVRSDSSTSLMINGEQNISCTTAWQRVVYKFEADEEDLVITFKTIGNYYFYNSQLETGDVATDWGPDPEDLNSDMSKLEVDVDGIRGQVSDVEGNVADLELESSQLTIRLDNLNYIGTNLALDTSEAQTYYKAAAASTYFNPVGAIYNSDRGITLIKQGGTFTVSFKYEITNCTTAFTLRVALKYTTNSYRAFGNGRASIPVGSSSGTFVSTGTPTAEMQQYGERWLFSGLSANQNSDIEMVITDFKFEKGDKATEWSPAPEDTASAAKVATNYLNFSSANGLVVGNHTASSLGANVQITSSGVNIRKNTTVWSSWTANRLEFFAGGKSALVLNNEPALRLGASDSHYIYANDTGLDIHNGSATVSSFHGSTITLGPTSGRNALINSAGLYLRSGTSNIAYFTASSARIYSGAGTDDYLNLGANRLEMFASGASRFVVTNGVTRIGNLSGKNVYIDSDSVNIRNGDTSLSNFSATTVNLGNNSSSAIINFCASNASITYNSNYGMLLERNNGALNVFASTYARVRGTTQTQLGDSSGASTTYIMCGSAAGNITLGGANRPIYAYVGSARRQLKQVYRLLNPNTLAYLTTADSSEANGLVAQGWTINNASVYYVFK